MTDRKKELFKEYKKSLVVRDGYEKKYTRVIQEHNIVKSGFENIKKTLDKAWKDIIT